MRAPRDIDRASRCSFGLGSRTKPVLGHPYQRDTDKDYGPQRVWVRWKHQLVGNLGSRTNTNLRRRLFRWRRTRNGTRGAQRLSLRGNAPHPYEKRKRKEAPA